MNKDQQKKKNCGGVIVAMNFTGDLKHGPIIRVNTSRSEGAYTEITNLLIFSLAYGRLLYIVVIAL